MTPSGRAAVYNVIEKPPAVWIVPITTQGQLAMVHQFIPLVKWCLEVPAGSVKPAGPTIEENRVMSCEERSWGTAASLNYAWVALANGICSRSGAHFHASRRPQQFRPQKQQK